ncbi:uncharacterized protein [Physcomitrium patens]|uniref:Epidermal patterning factor-like protein n=1 Tax=Physcomitrium patens TaxID=3218 RepID=A0A7I4E142_PHYPA|nr:uncharacterized protein LOC112283560 isoform X1 [Physcomitrium patens]|eukprot:XP_024378167.1 uncharacterized protein LOC112283560 isoform X1 [Physcomitrella patens]
MSTPQMPPPASYLELKQSWIPNHVYLRQTTQILINRCSYQSPIPRYHNFQPRLPHPSRIQVNDVVFPTREHEVTYCSTIETEGISPVKAPKPSNEKRLLIGSSAPECGHTCGACSPCKIQIVSYECEEDFGSHAEACPLGYLCLCHGKSFPIP